MIEIGGKKYSLKEISGRKYQALMDRMEKDFGADWQGRAGLATAVILLACCLVAEDGSSPTEDQLWDLPMRQLNKLSEEAMALNGLGGEAQAALEKN